MVAVIAESVVELRRGGDRPQAAPRDWLHVSETGGWYALQYCIMCMSMFDIADVVIVIIVIVIIIVMVTIVIIIISMTTMIMCNYVILVRDRKTALHWGAHCPRRYVLWYLCWKY